MIYNVYNEKQTIMKNHNRRVLPKLDGSDETRISSPSGDSFNSLANTDPEAINLAKLQQIKQSKNIVKEFNDYFWNLRQGLVDTANAELEAKKNATADDVSNYNSQIIVSYERDLDILQKELDLNGNRKYSDEDIKKMLQAIYLPESLSARGCRALINIRLNQSKILINTLTAAIKANYNAFNLSLQEANLLVDELNDENTSHEAMKKIKGFLENPSTLKKFKMGDNNYDFRPIGGGCMFLSKTPNIKISQKPSKKLNLIFKYDAIVAGHGLKMDVSIDKKSVKNFEMDSKEIERYLKPLQQQSYDAGIISKKAVIDPNNFAQIYQSVNTVIKAYYADNDIDKLYSKLDRLCGEALTSKGKVQFMFTHDVEIFNKVHPAALQQLKRTVNFIKTTKSPEIIKKDGNSQDWTCEPISTMKSSNLTSVVDIIRALKDEGFKNIYIGNCNPGGVKLPKDLRNSKDFHVTYGMHSVYLEQDYEEIDCIMHELYTLQETVFTEGKTLDFLKQCARKTGELLKKMWSKLIEIFKNITSKIRSKLMDLLQLPESKKKLNKPIEISVLNISSNGASLSKSKCSSVDDIKSQIDAANKSINALISKTKSEDETVIRAIENRMNKLNLKESGIFSECVFI